MKYIRNERDLRLAYEILQILSENADQYGKVVIETKQAIRQYTNREVNFDRRVIIDNGIDGFVSLERLPEGIQSLEEANIFFEQYRTCHYQPSAYDCTGQAMTNWFKVFPRNGGFYAYHSVSFDV